jgi:hypothetical protein
MRDWLLGVVPLAFAVWLILYPEQFRTLGHWIWDFFNEITSPRDRTPESMRGQRTFQKGVRSYNWKPSCAAPDPNCCSYSGIDAAISSRFGAVLTVLISAMGCSHLFTQI